MSLFSEDTALLDDKFKGSEVVLRAVVGGRVDKSFRANYTLAKYLVDRRKIKKIFVVVDEAGASEGEVAQATWRAFAGVAPHPAVVVGEEPLGIPDEPLRGPLDESKNDVGGDE